MALTKKSVSLLCAFFAATTFGIAESHPESPIKCANILSNLDGSLAPKIPGYGVLENGEEVELLVDNGVDGLDVVVRKTPNFVTLSFSSGITTILSGVEIIGATTATINNPENNEPIEGVLLFVQKDNGTEMRALNTLGELKYVYRFSSPLVSLTDTTDYPMDDRLVIGFVTKESTKRYEFEMLALSFFETDGQWTMDTDSLYFEDLGPRKHYVGTFSRKDYEEIAGPILKEEEPLELEEFGVELDIIGDDLDEDVVGFYDGIDQPIALVSPHARIRFFSPDGYELKRVD